MSDRPALRFALWSAIIVGVPNLSWGIYLYLTDHSDSRFTIGGIASFVLSFAIIGAVAGFLLWLTLNAVYRHKLRKQVRRSDQHRTDRWPPAPKSEE